MEIVNVDAGIDYRGRTLTDAKLYHCPLGPEADAALERLFAQLAEAHDEDPRLHIEQRELRARRRAGGVVWFDFATLCGGPRSQNDYLELATQFHTIFLSGVPEMPVRLASRGAALHLAGRRALRPPRQAGHFRRRRTRAPLHRGSAGP